MSNIESQTNNDASIQEQVSKARHAQIEYESFNQEQVDAIVRDIGKFVFDNAELLARMAIRANNSALSNTNLPISRTIASTCS